MNPIALFFLFFMGILLIALPRKYALVPFFLTTLYMTIGQGLIVFGCNFIILRMLIVIGFIRILFRRDISPIQLNSLDKVILLWSAVAIVTGFLLDTRTGSSDNLVHRSGQMFTALGIYFIFRFYITNINDIKRTITIFAIIIVPLAAAFLLERASGRNMFSIFGGVPEFTIMRYDRFRCQGPFRHPILAGTLGATMMPIFVSLLFEQGKKKLLGIISIISSIIIVVTSASSGPLLAWIGAIIALFSWPLRNKMQMVRWGILLGLITLHMIMKAPVWYLMAKISYIIGGTGWGRSVLIDYAIDHFNEWWLIGTTNTAHWDPVGVLPNEDMMDITNHYILEGVFGGLGRMLLFIAVIVFAYKLIGKSRTTLKNENFAIKYLPWALGAALFSHIVGYFSVAYFDQLIVIWYLLLAMISAIASTHDHVQEHLAAA